MFQNMPLKITSHKRWLLWILPLALACLVFIGGRFVSFLVWNYLLLVSLPLAHSLYGVFRIKAKVSAPAAVLFCGDSLTIECAVINPAILDWPVASFGSELLSAFRPESSTRFIALPAKTTVAWTADTECPRRGKYSLSQTVLSLTDIFNLYTVQRVMESPVNITVYPRAKAIDLIRISGNRQPGELSVIDQFVRNLAETTGLERYQAGTPVRYLHWRASARSPVWLQRSFGRSGDAACTILLNCATSDWQADHNGRLADLAAGLCASLIHYFLKAGIRTTLLYYRQSVRQQVSGTDLRGMVPFYEALAAFKPDAEMATRRASLAGFSQRLASSQSLIYLTPRLDDEQTLSLLKLYLSGSRPLCLMPLIEAAGAKDSEKNYAILRQHGIKVLKIEKESDLAHAVKQA